MNLIEKRNLYDRFLEQWPEERVEMMELADYVGVENQHTFCYWVERETRYLGSILGSPAIKFGIYKRKQGKKPIAQYANDSEYSWRPFYGDTRDAAYKAIRNEVLRVINLSNKGMFSEIEGVPLSPMFKWKIAFLYSNERLVPIYEEKTLRRISEYFGFQQGREINVSQIQELMMQNKPADSDIYKYMEVLWNQFSKDAMQNEHDKSITESGKRIPSNERRAKRKAVTDLNTNTQIRSVSRSYLVEQKHNKLQLLLREKLADEFGSENIQLEEDFVDLKLVQPEYITLYEVKSSSYALACVREAIGQLLYYSIRDEDPRPKKLVVIGQYPPNPNEEEFIRKLKLQLNVNLTYQHLPLS
ncbi:MAG TPA: hypothetical protein PKD24_08495 [Pyrinomonadaceae bacterium]|nr:hypothetical protein [Pyrinomonadaceae bacterium]HMP65893.1 hypothetical protein [Pyrinomonadaceae bacterium]